jgi:outer membrane receptor protein involved in Fe transport
MKQITQLVFLVFGVTMFGQKSGITLSGTLHDKLSHDPLPYANVVLEDNKKAYNRIGTITDEAGIFRLERVPSGNYQLEISYIGYTSQIRSVFIGSTSPYLDLGVITLEASAEQLDEVVLKGKREGLGTGLDKKTYTVDQQISQNGGSVLQSLQNLPGITIQDGQVQLRGNSRVMVLLDGKQTAITGFGNQNGLDNLPASAVDRIEIINNPSARFDANGNAGIINLVLTKETSAGLHGKAGITGGLGALWQRKENLPGIRRQYQATPKINPNVALNYTTNHINFFLQADNLYTQTLNKNEYTTRTYDDGTIIRQQMKRNRNTNLFTSRTGLDWYLDKRNTLTVSGFFSREGIMDRGDQPFYNANLTDQLRLWQFLEDEKLTAIMGSANFVHVYPQPGHKLEAGFSYTFDREDEKYFFDNQLPNYTSSESFALIADQRVADVNLDYSKPLKTGMLETGLKFRRRNIPTNMQFNPGLNSPLDINADGAATYKETIPAAYGNYTHETNRWVAELGMRMEYVALNYEVDPNHNTYRSDGYNYFKLFPNTRLSYNLGNQDRISLFYNERVDRPDEVDIRIFPKYDDAEIIKVGNPALKPQFTSTVEAGYRHAWSNGDFYAALYHKTTDGTITRIATRVASQNLIYNVSQNAGLSYNTGTEALLNQKVSPKLSIQANLNVYRNTIEAYSVINKYPIATLFEATKQELWTGNLKLITNWSVGDTWNVQMASAYLAPNLIPQGRTNGRYSMDIGIKKNVQNGRGQWFINATDLFNTLVIQKEIQGDGFSYTSKDYYETQVIRIGYSYKF